MKQLLTQLEIRMRRAASRLDAAYSALTSWFVLPTMAMSSVAVNAEPGFVATRTATDVHPRRPQEPSP